MKKKHHQKQIRLRYETPSIIYKQKKKKKKKQFFFDLLNVRVIEFIWNLQIYKIISLIYDKIFVLSIDPFYLVTNISLQFKI